MHEFGRVAAVFGALLVLAACSASYPSGPPSSTTTASTAQAADGTTARAGHATAGEVRTSALRTRVDIAVGGRFEIRVENTGTEPFTVQAVALDSPGFEPLVPTVKQSVFGPGTITDLRTPYGPVVCGSTVDPEPAYAVLDVVRADGSADRLRVAMQAPNDDIARMHAEGCAAASIAEAVTVTLQDLTWSEFDGAPALTGNLRLVRGTSTESIAVTDMRGSVVLKAAARAELPATMAADVATVDVPVYFRQATCDPHYLADTKQPVLFPLWLSFGGRDQEYSTIPVTEAHHDLLIDFLGEVCN